MTRPITWAVGSFAVLALAASLAGERLARLKPSAATASTWQSSGPSPAPINTDRILVLDGDRSGHFRVSATLDGRHLFMLVDTGASIVALTAEDAAAAGIRPAPADYRLRMATANGGVSAAAVRLREIRVGDITLRDVDAAVMPPGRLGTSLLGMSFLRKLRGFDVAGNRLTLRG